MAQERGKQKEKIFIERPINKMKKIAKKNTPHLPVERIFTCVTIYCLVAFKFIRYSVRMSNWSEGFFNKLHPSM